MFTSSQKGHASLQVYADGSVWVDFYAASATGAEGKLIFRKKIKEALPAILMEDGQYPSMPKTKEELQLKNGMLYAASVYPDSQRTNLNKAIFGRYNKELFFTEVEAPVLLLDEHLGGMDIIKAGGSTQTLSLRLKDPQGRVFNLRSLRKDPTRSLPPSVNFELTQTLMAHFLTGANPFGAFIVPDLAEAVKVYHTRPKLYYLPRQSALGEFNDRYGNQLFLLEERPDETWIESGLFGSPDDIVSYKKLFKEIKTEDEKLIKINQELALRNRFLDILIGDFDRHLDQFRFGVRKQKGKKIYDPIPRDRDLAFSKWDGLAHRIGTLIDPKIKASHNFDDEIMSIKWLNYQARGFDNYFLNELEWEDFRQIVQAMQRELSNEVIDAAVKNLPAPIYEKRGPKINLDLKKRSRSLRRFFRSRLILGP
ncbi:MAG: hypothetical protein AAFP02_14290, partial [Bacteroidota bacterium]